MVAQDTSGSLDAGKNSKPAPSPFSPSNPKLQLAWDATSLKLLMECPFKYQKVILEGWRKEGNEHTDFGGFFAACTETYHKARLEGRTKIEASILAVRKAIEISWVRDPNGDAGYTNPVHGGKTFGKPWGGEYATVWRCTGTEPYRNRKGNRAKCPYSHAGKWYPEPTPAICGECGSEVQSERRWHPDSKIKDRYGLVRLVSWYCDDQPEELGGAAGISPYGFPDGTPAVELSFKFPLPFKTKQGEAFILAGHLDKIGTFGEEHFITDNKTTSKTLSQGYWLQYSPNVQVDTYDLAGSVMFEGLGIQGVIIEGAQITANGAKFGIGVMRRTEALREEYLRDLEYYLGMAERYAEENYWPKNRSACFLCDFKTICSKEPDKREMYLNADFQRKHWNPLVER